VILPVESLAQGDVAPQKETEETRLVRACMWVWVHVWVCVCVILPVELLAQGDVAPQEERKGTSVACLHVGVGECVCVCLCCVWGGVCVGTCVCIMPFELLAQGDEAPHVAPHVWRQKKHAWCSPVCPVVRCVCAVCNVVSSFCYDHVRGFGFTGRDGGRQCPPLFVSVYLCDTV